MDLGAAVIAAEMVEATVAEIVAIAVEAAATVAAAADMVAAATVVTAGTVIPAATPTETGGTRMFVVLLSCGCRRHRHRVCLQARIVGPGRVYVNCVFFWRVHELQFLDYCFGCYC